MKFPTEKSVRNCLYSKGKKIVFRDLVYQLYKDIAKSRKNTIWLYIDRNSIYNFQLCHCFHW